MNKYVKPKIEITKLRTEERIAASCEKQLFCTVHNKVHSNGKSQGNHNFVEQWNMSAS